VEPLEPEPTRERWEFDAELWRYKGDSAWHFVTLPFDEADEIEERAAGATRGFGSVKVRVTVGATTWDTSLFPDSAAKSYVLPVKKAVRTAEDLADGEPVRVSLELL
jgi:hypothetical protein